MEPLVARLAANARGLDFGCGPGPALAAMLGERGFSTQLYDKFYYRDAAPLSERHDFITATEVVEHLVQPGEVLGSLWKQINPGGVFAIMTKRWLNREAFERWHYKNDPTHICFFHRRTFEYLAEAWQASLDFPGEDTVLIQKSAH